MLGYGKGQDRKTTLFIPEQSLQVSERNLTFLSTYKYSRVILLTKDFYVSLHLLVLTSILIITKKKSEKHIKGTKY